MEESRIMRKEGGDPVGSTDLEVSRICIPAPIRHVKCLCMQFWRLNAELMLVLGVQRPDAAYFWRWTPARCLFLAFSASSSSLCISGIWTPGCCLFLAFNARNMLCSGVERQTDAPYWRLNASKSFLQGVIFLLLFLILFLILIFFRDSTWLCT